MGVTLKDARVEVEKIIGRGSGFVAVEIPFTPRAKRVLELSLEEARQLGERRVVAAGVSHGRAGGGGKGTVGPGGSAAAAQDMLATPSRSLQRNLQSHLLPCPTHALPFPAHSCLLHWHRACPALALPLQATTTSALSTFCWACCARARAWPRACWRPWALTRRRSAPRWAPVVLIPGCPLWLVLLTHRTFAPQMGTCLATMGGHLSWVFISRCGSCRRSEGQGGRANRALVCRPFNLGVPGSAMWPPGPPWGLSAVAALQTVLRPGPSTFAPRQVIRMVGESQEPVGSTVGGGTSGSNKMPTLEEYGTNLTQQAEEGKLDPVVGRKKEIERVTQILGRRTKNNPVSGQQGDAVVMRII